MEDSREQSLGGTSAPRTAILQRGGRTCLQSPAPGPPHPRHGCDQVLIAWGGGCARLPRRHTLCWLVLCPSRTEGSIGDAEQPASRPLSYPCLQTSWDLSRLQPWRECGTQVGFFFK